MIKLFYTSVGCRDSTKFLLREAVEKTHSPDYSKILYFAPTSMKVEDAQKLFHQLQKNKCYIPPEMTTIRGYCKRLYSSYGNKKILRKPMIPVILSGLSGKGLGYSTMAADLVGDLKQLYPGKDMDFIRIAFHDVFREADVPDSIAGAVEDALDIFDRYQALAGERGLIDGDDIMHVVAETLKGSNESQVTSNELKTNDKGSLLVTDKVTRHSSLILDGFSDITMAEKNVLEALIRSSEDVYISIPSDPRFHGLTKEYRDFLHENFQIEEARIKQDNADQPPVLNYYAYSDTEEEVEGIARSIKSLYVSGQMKKPGEVAVVFPDLSAYGAMVERIFRRYGIPCEISADKKLGAMRPFLDVFCLLDSVSEGYARLKFAQFLSSKYFAGIPANLKKWIPSLSLHSGIISGKEAWLGFISEGSETLDMGLLEEKKALEKDLKWILKKLQPLDDLKEGAPLEVHAYCLKKILGDLGFPGPLQDPMTGLFDEPADNVFAKRILEATDDIFEQISFLGTLNPAPVSLSEFREVLKHLLYAAYPENESSGVRVMDFFEARGLSPQYLYFGGLSDGNLPKRQDMDYILPDNIKMKMGLMHLEKFNGLQKFIFEGITRAGRRLHLSYPLMEGDSLFLPSSFLYSGEEIRENIPGIFSKEEYHIRRGRRPLLDYMEEIGVHPSLMKRPSYLRVTDIDAYRSCPRRFFIEKELKLAPVGVKEYEVEAATVGTIIHRAMERIVQEPPEKIRDMREEAGALIDEITRDKRMDAYWKRLIRDTFVDMLPALYEKEFEIREAGYVSTETEKSISGELLNGIKLKGKVDRIDKIGDEFQIIDYKTGTAGLNCTQVLSGNENLQLFLYAALLKSHGYNIRRAGIYSLKDMHIKWCPPKRKGKGKEGGAQVMDNYIKEALRFLEDAVERMGKGDFRAKPLNDYACWNCHEYAFCPYIQQ